ncbi:HAMP domain-containing protein [Scopulibacillus darangshiensis]|uniref:histidine kinase n=1 Tax=Scopulibacillus darangshiensis TaxID=442528 RepID=A0A4R2P9N7_9BACL|nr:ATP-binding protein [Scopulibacillus darangshiensis]TCP31770.1 HAMP domain-containing protein [Scopulibacillus darangshiensis]
MKLSIRTKLFLILSSIVLLFVIITQLFSSFFLEDFYLSSKKDTLRESLNEVQQLLLKSANDYEDQLIALQDRKNISLIIADRNYNDIFSLAPYKRPFQRKRNTHSEELIKRNMDYFTNKPSIIVRTENRTKSQFLSLFSKIKLKDGSEGYVVISSSIDAMKDSVNAARTFILYLSLFVFVIGTLIIFYVSGSISKPIVKIGKLTAEMARLNFSQKIEVKSSDEIGDLSKNINSLSRNLNKTLTELEVVNEQLREDIKEKESIDHSRKELIANISHELKTPISLIGGYAEGLKVNVNNEDRDYYCDVILDEAKKMNRLVLDLLDLSQVDAGYKLMNKEIFNLTQLISHTLERYTLKLEEKRITITRSYNGNFIVYADPDRIEQALTNYLNNAINNIDGKRQIMIQVEEKDEELFISVFNTGKPISSDHLMKIWDSFYKIDKARTREYGGTGLGLSIVKAIVQAHGGKYGAKNCNGSVEFWFSLPKY